MDPDQNIDIAHIEDLKKRMFFGNITCQFWPYICYFLLDLSKIVVR